MAAQLYFTGSERGACKGIQGTLSIQKAQSGLFLHRVRKCHNHPYHWMFPSSLLITWVSLLSLVVLQTIQSRQRLKNITVTYIFNHLSFPSAQLLCFVTPLQGQQKKALARGPPPCDPAKYNGLKTLLSVTVEHFLSAILYSTYTNVFRYSCGAPLLLHFLCILYNIWFHDVNSSMQWGWCETHLSCNPKPRPIFHHVAVVTQQCTL